MVSMTMNMPVVMAPPGPSPSPTLMPASPAGYSNNNTNHMHQQQHHQQVASATFSGQGGGGMSNLSLALPLPLSNAVSSSPLATASAIGSSPDSIGVLRVKLVDMLPEDGAPSGIFMRTVESLSNSLARNNVAIIELSGEDATLVRCALESAKLYFRSRNNSSGAVVTTWGSTDWTKSTGYTANPFRESYVYRAGRNSYEDIEPPPPGMPEVFRCLGKASRASLSAIARHLRLRSDAFGSILDDSPLSTGDISSSVLAATSHHPGGSAGKSISGTDSGSDAEKGLLMLVASDAPGLQVCDPSGRWFLADNGIGPGDLILLTGRALQHATAGARKASTYRVVPLPPNVSPGSGGRTSLAFRLMPRSSATIDSTPMADAGHSVPDGYSPVTVAAFMDGLSAAEALMANGSENSHETFHANVEPSLRSILSDPLSGNLLDDAMVAHCGHSFGSLSLKRVHETSACESCGVAVELSNLIPNLALREAAVAFSREERNRNGVMRSAKRRKDPLEQGDPTRVKRPKQDLPSSPADKESALRTGGGKGVQYPFVVNERVMIKGNKRTPEKFVGREAHITSQCLNGWYLLKTLDNGESVRLQYRSLQKAEGGDRNGVGEEHHAAQGMYQ